MQTSQYLMATLREAPADAEIVSHRLMLRAGMIRQLAAGVYTWLPLGLRVLRKVEAIVRDEMDRAGAQELLMSSVQPAELWQESERWDHYGPELLRFHDRHERGLRCGGGHHHCGDCVPVPRQPVHPPAKRPVGPLRSQPGPLSPADCRLYDLRDRGKAVPVRTVAR